MEENKNGQYAASMYQQATENASHMEQLLMLYDGSIGFMHQAIEAIERKDWDTRWKMINKVCSIMSGLREILDFEQGKDTAIALDEFYYSVDMRLISVQHNNSVETCKQVLEDITTMRNAWRYAEQQVSNNEQSQEQALPSSAGTANATPPPMTDEIKAALASTQITV